MRRRLALVVVAVMLVGTACSSGSHRAADPTTTSSTSSTVPPGPDPYVVPSVITPAYVNAVLAVLEHINGNAIRSLLTARAVTPQVTEDLRAIYNDPLYARELEIARQDLSEDLTNVKIPPGDIKLTVSKLISASPTCIFIETTADYGAVLIKPPPSAATTYWGLNMKISANDPLHLNSTPWAFFFNAVYLSPTVIPNQCAI